METITPQDFIYENDADLLALAVYNATRVLVDEIKKDPQTSESEVFADELNLARKAFDSSGDATAFLDKTHELQVRYRHVLQGMLSRVARFQADKQQLAATGAF